MSATTRAGASPLRLVQGGTASPRSLRRVRRGNVNDKPRFIRDADHLTPTEKVYRTYYQKQLDSLRSVDDGVKRVIDTLGYLGRLRNTYVVFTSDNGFFFGEHRLLGGKFLAYEPATHMPFLIRGPGSRPGTETGELAANIDVAPTLLELAGAEATKSIDGRSLVPYLEDSELRSRASRRAGEATASLLAPSKDYAGIRLGPYKYIAWPSGEKELYNITRDPYELNSLHRVPNFFPIATSCTAR
jgi:N-acetylglucosamine-6-sulfatase